MNTIQEVATEAAKVVIFEDMVTVSTTDITFLDNRGEPAYSITVPTEFLKEVYILGVKEGRNLSE